MRAILALLLFAGTATAAPADWKSYLCRWGPADDSWHETQVVKVNEKDARVVINDRDVGDPKFKPDYVYFTTEDRRLPVSWTIYKDGRLDAMDRYLKRLQGTCKVVTD